MTYEPHGESVRISSLILSAEVVRSASRVSQRQESCGFMIFQSVFQDAAPRMDDMGVQVIRCRCGLASNYASKCGLYTSLVPPSHLYRVL